MKSETTHHFKFSCKVILEGQSGTCVNQSHKQLSRLIENFYWTIYKDADFEFEIKIQKSKMETKKCKSLNSIKNWYLKIFKDEFRIRNPKCLKSILITGMG